MPIDYRSRIQAIRTTKEELTAAKLEYQISWNGDDHGALPCSTPLPFKRIPNHPDGNCYGIRSCGENFGRWVAEHPVYIHPLSALAGGWTYGPAGVGGWRPEDKPTHLAELHQKYNYVQPGIGGMNHSGPDMVIGFELGWGGLLAKLRKYRQRNRPVDPAYYDGQEAVVAGTQEWIRRHVSHARLLADAETEPFIRDNLTHLADMNEWLIENPPHTFREACQFLAWFQSIDRMWFTGGALGQLDELLLPFYEADTAAGILTDDEAVWIIASLLFNDTHYSQIGGPAPCDGHDVTSPVSFLILEATHLLGIPSNIGIRVHDDLNPALFREAVEYLFEDRTGVCYVCSNGLDYGYARNGVPMGLARMRAKVGCNWTALPGIEYCLQDVSRVCMVAPFLLSMQEVEMPRAGTKHPAPTSSECMEVLWDKFAEHLAISVDVLKQGFDWHMRKHSSNSPELVLNLFAHGSVERGLDLAEGGVDIYRLTTDGTGLATLADSFAAIEQRVFVEKRLTWSQLLEVLETDFESAEDVRLMLHNIARYGSGGSHADFWAQRISDLFTSLVRDTPTADGWTILPGLFSHGNVYVIGEHLGATPNGRKKGEPISHSADPDPGFLLDGGGAPTAKSSAVALVQPKWGNTSPLQIDVDPSLVKTPEVVEALIRTHNTLGGSVININVVSKEDILRAHENPSLYPDLVVRVTGYSAYFKSLSREYRQQVVDRVLGE